MSLNPISIATRGYAPLAVIAVATFGYVSVDDVLYAEGGISLSGQADFTTVTHVEPEGGIVLGGAASFEFVPAGGGGTRRWYRLGLGT